MARWPWQRQDETDDRFPGYRKYEVHITVHHWARSEDEAYRQIAEAVDRTPGLELLLPGTDIPIRVAHPVAEEPPDG